METDPTKDTQEAQTEKGEPGTTEGPGNVTVDEPTDPALSGTSADDFADGDEPDRTSDS